MEKQREQCEWRILGRKEPALVEKQARVVVGVQSIMSSSTKELSRAGLIL